MLEKIFDTAVNKALIIHSKDQLVVNVEGPSFIISNCVMETWPRNSGWKARLEPNGYTFINHKGIILKFLKNNRLKSFKISAD